MAQAVLNLHAGGHEVSEEELQAIAIPERTKSWVPIRHKDVLSTAIDTLKESGYVVKDRRLAISHGGARFFGTLDLATELTTDGGVTLAVGLRNSFDQSFPMGFVAGSRVFVCSNLSFSADLTVKRKHTVNGAALFSRDIAASVMKLAEFKANETQRIERLQGREMSLKEVESSVLNAAVYKGIIPLRMIRQVLDEWHEPMHEQFQPRTAWSLLNAFTSVLHDLQGKNPHDLAIRTMRLQSMLVEPPVVAV